MKIIADENIPYVQSAFSHMGTVETLAGREICQSDLIDADILLVRSITQVNAPLLDNTSIKFIASATSGINHIDLDYLQNNNIGFAHALGSNAISVAQYVISGICYWSKMYDKPLNQLSLGIIGYGCVGKQLEKIATKLGITCVLNDPPLSDNGTNGLKDIESALKCDIVSIHVPLNFDGKYPTNHLINSRNIQQLQSDCLFINAARGGVVDEKSLLSFKNNHPQFQIILDVWENEPNINLEMLAQTLIATPHIAGYSFDGKLRGTEMIYQACCRFFEQTVKWSLSNIKLNDNPQVTISNNGHIDIRNKILKAYDILQEDKQIKQLLTLEDINTGLYFDNLRKNYPIRREWIDKL